VRKSGASNAQIPLICLELPGQPLVAGREVNAAEDHARAAPRMSRNGLDNRARLWGSAAVVIKSSSSPTAMPPGHCSSFLVHA
jgi:hypothetical protein